MEENCEQKAKHGIKPEHCKRCFHAFINVNQEINDVLGNLTQINWSLATVGLDINYYRRICHG
jgi:hypothetical protein